jgi:hypothetical protein
MKQLQPACQEMVPRVQALFEFGVKQHERTMRALAREKAAEKKAAAEKKDGSAPEK